MESISNRIRNLKAKELLEPQDELDLMAQMDEAGKFDFLKEVTNWDNHKPLLLVGLCLTIGPVLELGSGNGSTPYLRSWCYASKRLFKSYDTEEKWAKTTGAQHIRNWDEQIYEACGLCFIDHAPGEHRHIAARIMKNMADIICLHDTELRGAGNYQYEKIWPLFKYQLHYNRTGGGAGASLVSNNIDVSRYVGCSLNGFTFEA